MSSFILSITRPVEPLDVRIDSFLKESVIGGNLASPQDMTKWLDQINSLADEYEVNRNSKVVFTDLAADVLDADPVINQSGDEKQRMINVLVNELWKFQAQQSGGSFHGTPTHVGMEDEEGMSSDMFAVTVSDYNLWLQMVREMAKEQGLGQMTKDQFSDLAFSILDNDPAMDSEEDPEAAARKIVNKLWKMHASKPMPAVENEEGVLTNPYKPGTLRAALWDQKKSHEDEAETSPAFLDSIDDEAAPELDAEPTTDELDSGDMGADPELAAEVGGDMGDLDSEVDAGADEFDADAAAADIMSGGPDGDAEIQAGDEIDVDQEGDAEIEEKIQTLSDLFAELRSLNQRLDDIESGGGDDVVVDEVDPEFDSAFNEPTADEVSATDEPLESDGPEIEFTAELPTQTPTAPTEPAPANLGTGSDIDTLPATTDGGDETDDDIFRQAITSPRENLTAALKAVEDEGSNAWTDLAVPANPHPKKTAAYNAWQRGFKKAAKGGLGITDKVIAAKKKGRR